MLGNGFCERGYIVLIQDCRGTGDSDGEFDPGFNETRDGKATLRWVRSQPWFQQCPKIGTWGPSYLGLVQLAVIENESDDKEAPPDAMVPIMTSSNFRNVIAPMGGGLHLSLFCRWHYITNSQMKRREKGNKENLLVKSLKEGQMIFQKMDSKCNPAFHCPLAEVDKTITEEETYLGTTLLNMCFSKNLQVKEEFWARRNYVELLRKAQKMPNILLIAGWYDIFLDDQISDFLYMSSVEPENVRLIVGGWHHFDISAFSWGMSEGINHFEATLKGKTRHDKKETKKVKIYVMGKEKWIEMDQFPPRGDEIPSSLYFLAIEGTKKMLSSSPAVENNSSSKYIYDPSDPTPSIGGREFHPKEAGQRANNTLEKRHDILVFTTHALKNRVDLLGHVKVTLFMKFSTLSVDVFVRLCVVGATVGRSKNMSDGYLRVYQQKGEEGRTKKVELFLSPCACTFHKGDKIRIQVASGAHPRYHPNNGTGDPFSTDLEKSEVEIFHDEQNPSMIILNYQEEE
uniref:Xaa-Pro dipeptidyl-peptidase C-terminal domain-containing protein n=1 Tax=Paramoeba aestuarina TaxID=180227 RepID=A0A7S4NF82_9EUKA